MTPPHVLLVTSDYLLCCLILKVITGSSVISPCLITLTGFLFMGWTKALKCIWEPLLSSHNHAHNIDVAIDYLFSRLILKEITGSSASSPCLDWRRADWGASTTVESAAETRAVLSSCHSWNSGDGCLPSTKTPPTLPLVSLERNRTRRQRTVPRLSGDKFGIKMVIRVYIASSTGSVAVSVYKARGRLHATDAFCCRLPKMSSCSRSVKYYLSILRNSGVHRLSSDSNQLSGSLSGDFLPHVF